MGNLCAQPELKVNEEPDQSQNDDQTKVKVNQEPDQSQNDDQKINLVNKTIQEDIGKQENKKQQQQVYKDLIIDSSLKLEKEHENKFQAKDVLSTKCNEQRGDDFGWSEYESESTFQSWSLETPNLISNTEENGFMEAIRNAYSFHIPLILSPDTLWCVIMQSFSKHVENNAEKLRKYFVNFDGKQQLNVQVDHFIFGKQNNWEEVFPQFSGQIKSFIGDKNHQALTADFSTTGPLEKSISELQLMNTMKAYFSSNMRTCCGMTKIRFMGCLEDWIKLKEQTQNLAQYEFNYWVEKISPILDKFIEAYKGEVDKTFWNSIYKQNHQSGRDTAVTGWICNFFTINPKELQNLQNAIKQKGMIGFELHREKQKNKDFKLDFEPFNGIEEHDLPTGLCKTPFTWKYHDKEYEMQFVSGFAGAHYDGEFIKPVLSWGVQEKQQQKNNSRFLLY